ncbi:MAG: zinc metalloprotease HtpX [Planctomycetota bacterium]|nr:zinc metalloprotease HtpX [Planctomycetota bacterium]
MNQRIVEQRLINFLHSVLLLGGMGLLLGLSGWLLAGLQGILAALLVGTLLLVWTPRSSKLLLRAQGARELHPALVPDLYRLVADLSGRAELSRVPRLYIIPSPAMNAVAVDARDGASIAVTDGLLRGLSVRELAGVLGHEIAHLRNRDTGILLMAEVTRRLTHLLSFVGLFLLVFSLPALWGSEASFPLLLPLLLLAAPVLSALLKLALSRTREFAADLEAARMTGDPAGLASALQKIERSQQSVWMRLLRAEIPWLKLLETHPEGRERVRRLLDLQSERGAMASPVADLLTEVRPRVLVERLPATRRSPLEDLLARLLWVAGD